MIPRGQPWAQCDHRLTGQIRSRLGIERTGMFTKRPVLVIQVQEEYLWYPVLDGKEKGETKKYWRDMHVDDYVLIAQDGVITFSGADALQKN